MTQLTDSVYAVEVPEGATCIAIENFGLDDALTYIYVDKIAGEMKNVIGVDDLPPGIWQLLCTTREATEEIAKGIVEYDKFIDGYKDYDADNFHHDTPFIKAIDSLRSLLASKGLDGNKNYVLLKKK